MCSPNRIFRIICIFVLSGILTGPLIAQAATPGGKTTLTIVNWEEWLSPKVIEQFERRENAKITVLAYDSVEKSLDLASQNRGRVDILVGSTVMLDQLKAQHRLRKLDRAVLTNTKHIPARFNPYPEFGVPYLWGFTGIIVRTDLVKKPVRNYADLFALAREMPGKVSLLSDPVEYAYALLWGQNPAKADPENIAALQSAVELHRKTLADKVRLFDVSYEDDNPIATGRIVAAQATPITPHSWHAT